MAVYMLKREGDGHEEEKLLSYSEFDAAKQDDGTLLLDGEAWRVNVGAQQRSVRHVTGTWPMYCDASGVGVDQRVEATAEFAKHGLRVEFDGLGRAIYESPGHRRKALAVLGMHDRNAGYSDPTPEYNRRWREARGMEE